MTREDVPTRATALPVLGSFLRSHREHDPVAPEDQVAGQRPHGTARLGGPHRLSRRNALAELLGIAGLFAYNWWLLVPFKPGLLRSPGELFSDMEVTGQPFARAMQHADLVSGVLILVAFLVQGNRSISAGRREWWAMVVFAASCAIGGVFTEACPDGVSATCRRLEWTFQLPLHHYLHIAAGILEFGAITVALLYAHGRTRNTRTHSARIYRVLTRGAFVAYPLLGLAYLTNVLGSVIEGVFFVGFTVIVLTELFERSVMVPAALDPPVATG